MASKSMFLFFLFKNSFLIIFFYSKHMKTLAVVAGNVLSCCCYCIQAAAFDFYSELLPKVCWTIVVLQEAEKLLILLLFERKEGCYCCFSTIAAVETVFWLLREVVVVFGCC